MQRKSMDVTISNKLFTSMHMALHMNTWTVFTQVKKPCKMSKIYPEEKIETKKGLEKRKRPLYFLGWKNLYSQKWIIIFLILELWDMESFLPKWLWYTQPPSDDPCSISSQLFPEKF